MSTLLPVVVVDTDVVSFVLKRDTRRTLYAQYLRARTRYVSFATAGALYYWAEDRQWGPRLRRDLDVLLQTFRVLDNDEALCRVWAQVRYTAKRMGRPVLPNDAWIAATALHLGAPLVTHNRRDFVAVPGLQMLPETTP